MLILTGLYCRNDFLDYFTVMITFLLWLILFILCWPLAIFALVLYPLVWLLLLPFRILGIAVDGVMLTLKEILFLPVRLLKRK